MLSIFHRHSLVSLILLSFSDQTTPEWANLSKRKRESIFDVFSLWSAFTFPYGTMFDLVVLLFLGKKPGSSPEHHHQPHQAQPQSQQQTVSSTAMTALDLSGSEICKVGHYDLIKTIGKGNFAVVKLAKHTITGHKVSQRRTLSHWQIFCNYPLWRHGLGRIVPRILTLDLYIGYWLMTQVAWLNKHLNPILTNNSPIP